MRGGELFQEDVGLPISDDTAGLASENGVLSQGRPKWSREMICIQKSDLPSRRGNKEQRVRALVSQDIWPWNVCL